MAFEPDNIQDRNAMRVEVHLDQDWHIIGYIPVPKIKKFTKAIRRGELRYVELKDHPQMELHPIHAAGLTVSIIAVKKCKWDSDDSNPQYNADLTHLV